MALDFSVLVPTYNSEKFVKILCKSINEQVYKNFEVVFVDNNSKDRTVEEIKKNISKKINFKFVKINNNGIIAKSRNLAISKCRGRYIAFHDSDDFWYPNKLLIMHKMLNNCDLMYHDMYLRYNFLFKRKIYSYNLNKKIFKSLLIKGNPLSTSAVVIKKDILISHKFSEERKFNTVEDFDLWIDLAFKNYKFNYVNKTLGFIQSHKNNFSKLYNPHCNSYKYFHIFNKYKNNLSLNEKKYSKNYFRYLAANNLPFFKKKTKLKYYFYFLKNKKIKINKFKIILKLIINLI